MTRSTPEVVPKKSVASDPTPLRFVVLRHDAGIELTRTTQSHYDWMFEVGGVLRTWATQPIIRFDQAIETACESLSDHRLAYLDYEGEIQGNRGSVMRLLRGTYRLATSTDDEFIAALCWQKGEATGKATVRFYRSLPAVGLRRDDSCEVWRFRFSPGLYETNR